MDLKSLELDAAGLLSEVMYGHGFAHYGYFPEGPPETLSAAAFGAAQQAYFERLVGAVPEGTKSILDVGSGTGANARALVKRGFDVTCVSPSVQMNEMARRKLPPGTEVIDAKFEDYEGGEHDCCLFAESFHYIELQPAFDQLARVARQSIVIFDYFRRPGFAHGGGTRGTHAAFCEAVEAQGVFAIESDVDETDAIAPSFAIHDHIKNAHVAPFVKRFRSAFRAESRLKAWAAEKVLGRALDKFERASSRSDSFPKEHEYRLVVLTRREA
ncbi:class I SAM-dependent methyltransferase [Ovoidimarina sediminis]|uniref:class I SAM-dependent methyltransferase n=1 Tax=Ovoidimarina sediminis TaxID=3079856 RepID=UPI0029140847|nr:class I SAM-dependent methyltransferase [Rhodophyticola sp. MJ-SS7]MDU8942343.1 class I SAM-dependent methyltransferase [Rhodophyticola sp. MJ-SS7]